MSTTEDFLTASEEELIIKAIRKAEEQTSGEIRVHLEGSSSKEALVRAQELFYFLNMHKTKDHNGVLFYVATDDHKFAVVGDQGIHQAVPVDFWSSIKDIVLSHFSTKSYAKGLEVGILETGKKLKAFFPRRDDDMNELPDGISLG